MLPQTTSFHPMSKSGWGAEGFCKVENIKYIQAVFVNARLRRGTTVFYSPFHR